MIQATGQRFGCHMISAITNKGALAFMVFEGKFKVPVFVAFLRGYSNRSPERSI